MSFLGINNDIWVGGTMNSGQWKWTDSTDFIYTNWRDGNIPSSGLKFEKK